VPEDKQKTTNTETKSDASGKDQATSASTVGKAPAGTKVEERSSVTGEGGPSVAGPDRSTTEVKGLTGDAAKVPGGDITHDAEVNAEGEIVNVRAGSVAEDPDQDGRAEGSSESPTGPAGTDTGEANSSEAAAGDDSEEDPLSNVTKRDLKNQAAELGVSTAGTKEDIATRIQEQTGEEIVESPTLVQCSHPQCIRPPHPATPMAHAYGQTRDVIGR
jgi:hypothetical protein